MDERWDWVREHVFQIILLVMGLTAMVVGGVQMIAASQGSRVEVVSETVQEQDEVGGLVVDVAGAVGQPGVYSMETGVRVADALDMAGGLTDDADLVWVAKMVNQAQPVTDGMKIYIPFLGENVDVRSSVGDVPDAAVAGVATVNVNSASKEELEGLWGIGETRAEAIISNRPYSSVDELKDKAGVPQNVIDKNREVMGVY